MLAFCNASVMFRPLQSLMAGIFSLFPLRFLHICRTQTNIYPLCLVLILIMPPMPISWLQVAAWIVVSDFLSVLCGTKRSILSYTIFLKLFHISSTLLPLLAHITNLLRRKVCKPETFVCCRPGIHFLLAVQCMCPPIPLPESLRDDH